MSIGDKLLKSAAAGGLTPSENFKTVTYTGNSSSQAITGVGFKPDLVWIKERSEAENHNWIDSTRGTSKILSCNLTGAEFTSTRFTSFDTDGFTLANNNETNDNGVTYVAWCWKANGGTTSSNGDGNITSTVQANTDAGFSIVKYSGTGSNVQVGHGLGAAPTMVIFKNLTDSVNWYVWTTATGSLARIEGLNTNSAAVTSGLGTTLGASTIDFTNTSDFSASGKDYIMYCFRDIDAYSKFGSYTGDRTNDVIVETGFEVGWVMIKAADATDDWFIISQETGNTQLYANKTDAEASFTGVSFLSNGFMLNGSANSGGTNNAGTTFIYMAFATDPDTEAPELASSFNIETYTGTGSGTPTISGVGFEPNMIWIKDRSASHYHILQDSVRTFGSGKNLNPNNTNAQGTDTDGEISSTNSDGFVITNGNGTNNSGENYVAWTWKANDDDVPTYNDNGSIDSIVSANANAGFSIVQWTGTGGNATVGHGLSSAPDVVIVKNLDSTTSWLVYHSAVGATKAFYLETTNAPTTNSTFWNDTAPTATTISIGTHSDGNASGDKIIAYCFHDVTGYSKFGSYTGDGNAGKTITTGFKPDWILIKSTVGADNWRLYDTLRGIKGGGYLEPNRSDADDTSNAPSLDIKATGFEITSGGVTNGDNANGNLYTYYAFAKNVASNTTLAKSFGIATWTGNDNNNRAITGLGFKPDFVWIKRRSGSESSALYDAIRGPNQQIISDSSAAQATNSATYMGLPSFDSDGFSVGNNGGTNRAPETYVGWAWKAGNTWQSNIDGTIPSTVNVNTANGFSIVKYTATGTTATVGHGLSSAPEFIMAKVTNQAYGWVCYHTSLGSSKVIYLNTNDAAGDSTSLMNATDPTSSVFTAGASNNLNYADGNEIIAYCFHSVAGYSKFGTYNGSGSDGNAVSLGFQPDFVMIKRTNDTGGWLMFDSARNTSNPRNNRLEADSSAAATTGSATKNVDFNSTDFEANGSDTEVNASGSTYIYMAFKIN